MVAREYIDEAESGRVADRPQFTKMLDETAQPNASFREILVWMFSRFTPKREHAVAFKSMLRRRGIRVTSIAEHAEAEKQFEALANRQFLPLDQMDEGPVCVKVHRAIRLDIHVRPESLDDTSGLISMIGRKLAR